MKAAKTILFVPKWYPNENDVQLGVFIQKHAKALAMYANVKVVYVTHTEDRPRVEVKRTGNLEEVVEYIYSSNRILSWFVKRKAYSKWFEKFNQADVVHAHVLGMSSFYAYRFAKRENKGLYLTEHWTGYYSGAYDRLPKVEQRLYKFLYKKFSRISVVSSFLKRQMIHHFGSQDLVVIGNVVEPIETDESNTKHILVVGDLRDKMKNISGTIHAYNNSALYQKGFSLHVIGGGEDRQLLQSLVKDNQIKGVSFLGRLPQNETQQKISEASFVVINSRYETFSVVAIEALSSGVPLIATKCGGPEDFLSDQTGLLVDVDQPQQLLDAMLQMSVKFQTYDKRKLQAVANNYSPEKIGKQLFNLYQFKS